MNRIWNENEVSSDVLAHEKVVVVGYGSQGRAQALNLRDHGLDVAVALRTGGDSWTLAEKDGWTPLEIRQAVAMADVVMLLVPDMAQPKVFEEEVAPHLRPGALLLFSHGFNVHYDFVDLPGSLDVGLVAPKAPGRLVRLQYEQGRGVPCLVSVQQDWSGTAWPRTLAYAHALGGSRAGLLETTFAEETETDLFGEQAVLCGGVTELVTAGWETLVEAGYNPQVAYFECMHELKLIVDLLYEGGLARMHEFVSDTASFGDVTRGHRVVDSSVRERMREVLADVRSGAFAKEWRKESDNGSPNFGALLKRELDHPIEAVGRDLRSKMTWLAAESGGTP
jgi:ketol-acid reductoisomerase